jgi:GMP synthase (glutamine-hydrolysing)
VTAVLLHEAIGDQLTCIYVDTGLMRANESKQVVDMFRGSYNIPLIHEDASEKFLNGLEGISEPEMKRKLIGTMFIDVFEKLTKDAGQAEFLAQGTLYPDVIESPCPLPAGRALRSRATTMSVACPETMKLKLVEPLRELFKDEVRALGRELGHARGIHQASPVPRPRPRHPHSRRDHEGETRNPAQGRHGLSRGNPERRIVRRNLAGLRRAAPRQNRGRHGRRPHV